MRKLFKLLLPVFTGILVILGILKVEDLAKDMMTANFNFNTTDMGNVVFYYVLFPIAFVIALFIHWIVILPIIRKLDTKPTFWRLRLMHYIALISVIASGIVGYIFWRKTELVVDVFLAVITSFMLFFAYFIITVLLAKGIDHFDIKEKKSEPNESSNTIDEFSSKM